MLAVCSCMLLITFSLFFSILFLRRIRFPWSKHKGPQNRGWYLMGREGLGIRVPKLNCHQVLGGALSLPDVQQEAAALELTALKKMFAELLHSISC